MDQLRPSMCCRWLSKIVATVGGLPPTTVRWVAHDKLVERPPEKRKAAGSTPAPAACGKHGIRGGQARSRDASVMSLKSEERIVFQKPTLAGRLRVQPVFKHLADAPEGAMSLWPRPTVGRPCDGHMVKGRCDYSSAGQSTPLITGRSKVQLLLIALRVRDGRYRTGAPLLSRTVPVAPSWEMATQKTRAEMAVHVTGIPDSGCGTEMCHSRFAAIPQLAEGSLGKGDVLGSIPSGGFDSPTQRRRACLTIS